MIDRLKSKTAIATAAALVAALGVGGVAVAQNSTSGTTTPVQKMRSAPGEESNAPDNSAADQDNVQAGDQGGSERSGEQSGSEVQGNDGPGGHADEPGNANADHQASGQE